MNRFAQAQTPQGSPAHQPASPKVPEIPHLLSMRVTTLLKPSFFASSTLAFETLPKDTSFTGDAVPRIEARNDLPNRSQALSYCGVGELLQFTTGSEFYLSDTFTFYLHLNNESEQVAKSVGVVVAIKDPQSNNKSVLDTTVAPKDKLDPLQQSDYIIRFHLTEPGSHVLGIKVQYTNPAGETRSLTKHFKFTVSKPAAVESSLVATLPTGFLVKTVVSNLTTSFPLLLEQVEFLTSDDLIVRQLTPSTLSLSQSQHLVPENSDSSSSSESPDLGILDLSTVSVLRPGGSIQHLFEVTYRNMENFDPKSITTLGQAAANWRFPMGEPCSSASSPIFVNFSSRKPFTFVVSSIPTTVRVQQAFNVSFLIHNISSAAIRPRLVAVKSKMEGILLIGLTGILAPKLEPNETYTFNVKAIAIEPGVQFLHGVRITELEKDKIYDLNSVFSINAEL